MTCPFTSMMKSVRISFRLTMKGGMLTRKRLLCVLVPLLASTSAFDADAGVTISDRRYWPNEARGSPGQAIEIHPPSIAYPGVGPATAPRLGPRRKGIRTQKRR